MEGSRAARAAAAAGRADVRLIERWLPIAALGIESTRERTPMTPFPAPNRLHVWWTRKPLVASRAAVLASLLPAEADRAKFLHVLGIHGDPVAARRKLEQARRTGVRVDNPYVWDRAFAYSLSSSDQRWLEECGISRDQVVLDPTAGGGSIPFEAARLGLVTFANDLNAVAAVLLKATLEYPFRHGSRLKEAFAVVASEFRRRLDQRLAFAFPQHRSPDALDMTYLWARTVRCPHCEGLVPLGVHWRLAPDGTGVRLVPHLGRGPGDLARRCGFEIVREAAAQSRATVADGDGLCPFPDCGRVIPGEEIKAQAQAGRMGEQLFAVVYKRRVETRTKNGKRGKDRWERGFRAPRPEDDNAAEIAARLAEKLAEWEALDLVPTEEYPPMYSDRSAIYGVRRWRDLFSPRQLLCHGTGVEVYRELLAEYEAAGRLDDVTRAAFVYLALALDKMVDYNSRMCRWHSGREVMVNTFDRHDFSFKWSYAEMAPLIAGLGYDWVIGQVAKCIEELVELARPDAAQRHPLLPATAPPDPPPITVTCTSADRLDHIADRSIDAVVIDPPYYDSVMHAELADFFYVWLKRTAGRVVPELFTRRLTDKENEVVVNPAKFAGQEGAKALAARDYRERMARIFAECRRVLKPDGIMTVMFNHKGTGAWDSLTTGLMEAGFVITASWPVNTEAEGSLHIRDKAAVKSTVLLACRPRGAAGGGAPTYWEDVEPEVARAVRARVAEFQQAGIAGVDLYLACFGPALEVFSRHWPLTRGTPRKPAEAQRRQRRSAQLEEAWDPYAVTPEDALDAARREVKRWRFEQLSRATAPAELDPLTSFFILAWDTFKAPEFPYDEGLRLARAVGVDLDAEVIRVLGEKKGDDVVLWDSATRAAKGALGPPDGSRAMVDALHHLAHAARSRTLAAAKELAERTGVLGDARFTQALTCALEVLPPSRRFSGLVLEGALAAASDDFEALESLRRLALADRVPEPEQLKLFAQDAV